MRPSIAQSPHHRVGCLRLDLECLEARVVPTVTVNDNPADYQISIDSSESVTVGATAGGDLRVTVNGTDMSIPARAASTIASLTITASGTFNNTIDLTGVTATDFT